MKTITEAELKAAIKAAKEHDGITFPPEFLPEAEDQETAIVIVDGIPFQ